MPLRRDTADRFLALCDTMTTLRSPGGCAWDREQTLKTLRSYLLEEAHEVLDVLDGLDADGGGPRVAEHKDELGDLMLQIVFQSEIQREAGRFDIGDVCDAIRDKLIRRHPHIFAGAAPEGRPGSKEGWEAIKRKERAARDAQGGADARPRSALDGVPRHLPGLLRAYRTGEKARGAGFDWPSHHGVIDKIKEELSEVEGAIATGDKERISAEIGDLLYAIVNLSRHFEIDAEGALRSTIARFEERFRLVEESLAAEGKTPEKESLDELERRWQQAKKLIEERRGASSAG
jgi:tetrapyrrole methylase family protein / MazG family protein